jgi:hypothetical protein
MLEHRFDVSIRLDFAAVFGAQFGGVELARRINSGDLSVRAGVDGRDVRGGDPAVTNNAHVIFFHKILSFGGRAGPVRFGQMPHVLARKVKYLSRKAPCVIDTQSVAGAFSLVRVATELLFCPSCRYEKRNF